MFCKNCGKQIPDGYQFCDGCGAPVDQATAQPTPNAQQQAQQFTPPQPTPNTQQNSYANYTQPNNQAYTQPNYSGYTQPQSNTAPGGYRAPIQQRNIALCIILSIITCGIYGIYWTICIVNDLNTAAQTPEDTSGGLVFLLGIVTCNIYMLYWYYKAGEKVSKIKQMNGDPDDSSNGILYLLLVLVGLNIVSICLIQNELNRVAAN